MNFSTIFFYIELYTTYTYEVEYMERATKVVSDQYRTPDESKRKQTTEKGGIRSEIKMDLGRDNTKQVGRQNKDKSTSMVLRAEFILHPHLHYLSYPASERWL